VFDLLFLQFFGVIFNQNAFGEDKCFMMLVAVGLLKAVIQHFINQTTL